ncbi:MAG: aldo/keto reductase [Caulobacteraceae bacterium]
MSEAAARVRAFRTPLGRVLPFTVLGLGGAPLGNLGRALREAEVESTLEAAWRSGARHFDTAPLYGHGLSETRVGRFLGERRRESFLLSTKVGRRLEPCASGEEESGVYLATPPFRAIFDYTRGGVLSSWEASRMRIGLSRIDILYVHDLETRAHDSASACEARWRELIDGGGWQALSELRAAGEVDAIGLGVNDASACERFLAELDPDLFLLAGRYTLLEQAPLHTLFPACARRGVGIVIGGPYNSGALARASGTYDYGAIPGEAARRVGRLSEVCTRFGVPLAAAALQFALAPSVVVGVIPGSQSPEEALANADFLDRPIPVELWSALKSDDLIDPSSPLPVRETPAC